MAARDWWKLARGVNVLMGAITVPVGALIVGAAGQSDTIVSIDLHTISVATFMAGWNTLNDLEDIEADIVNHPDRPLAKGTIDIPSAKNFYRAMMAVSFLSLLAIVGLHDGGPQGFGWLDSVLIWMTALILMYSYEYDGMPFNPCLKRRGLAGNLSVSGLIAVVIVFGASAVDSGLSPLPWSVALCAMMIGTAREIVKDIEDMGGDEGRDTLPMKVGAEKARITVWVFTFISFITIGLPFALDLFPLPFIGFMGPAIFYLLLVKGPIAKGEDTKASKYLKRALLFGLLGFTACGVVPYL
ncbi:MAG: geranylgeranylglycerol-phosphate geranylgeranyltransferase [Euryarchaeota archaeon]|nr:geranylgeranylglycerol-phosphate geranylgeranyltransferase [Euryarchaeota archaeon]